MLDTNLIKVKVLEETSEYGKFEIEPLERGYAQTLGNVLRRVLLSSLEGAAVTAIKINGAKHEYATIPGVEEDVLTIILNLKKLKINMFTTEPETLYLTAKKAGQVTAGDLEASSNVEILNKDLVIATVSDNKASLSVEIIVEKGIGYMNVDNRRKEIGLLPIDANFSPVERVNVLLGSARVGQVTDLDKLTLEIYTTSILPGEALKSALTLAIGVLSAIKVQIVGEEEIEEEKPKKESKKSK